MIVAVEGGDACGKATQTKLLAERLGGTRFSFPDYDTPTGRAIRENLQGEWFCTAKDVLVLQSLMFVNRFEVLPRIREAHRHGPVVLDRYWISGVVYGAVEGLDPEWISGIHTSLVQPDLWILLDVPVEESFRRRPERRDRLEIDRDHADMIRREYLRLFSRTDPLTAEAWRIVDGTGSVDTVAERIWDLVSIYQDR